MDRLNEKRCILRICSTEPLGKHRYEHWIKIISTSLKFSCEILLSKSRYPWLRSAIFGAVTWSFCWSESYWRFNGKCSWRQTLFKCHWRLINQQLRCQWPHMIWYRNECLLFLCFVFFLWGNGAIDRYKPANYSHIKQSPQG